MLQQIFVENDNKKKARHIFDRKRNDFSRKKTPMIIYISNFIFTINCSHFLYINIKYKVTLLDYHTC